jgi:cobalt-zinc-cadmium efflux system membrane fusion protein
LSLKNISEKKLFINLKEKIIMRPFYYILIIMSMLAVSCQSPKAPVETASVEIGSPPSISGKKPERILVTLTPVEKEELSIETITMKSEQKSQIMAAPGMVYPSPDKTSLISAPVDGRVVAIEATEGEFVRKSEVLFTIESLEFGTLVSDLLQSEAAMRYQESRLKRLEQLTQKRISPESELEKARSDYDRASAIARAAYAKLKTVGISNKEIEAYAKLTGDIHPVLHLRAPLSGTIQNRFVELGQSVKAYDQMARIMDASYVLVRGFLAPDDARFVRKGDSVRIARRNSDEVISKGVINAINPGLDEDNRSVIVYVELAGVDDRIKPGQNIRMEIKARFPEPVMTVPMSALTFDGDIPVIFVKTDENTFEQRALKTGAYRNGFAVVNSGLSVGEEVAVTQVFSLKALARYKKFAD